MSDRLYRTGKELRKALDVDIADFKRLKREGYDTSGIRRVIRNKQMMIKRGTWK